MKIHIGKFEAELNYIEKTLKKLDFFEERNYYPNEDFDPATYRSKSYFNIWNSLIAENIYNFIFSDSSILHFKINAEKTKLNFTFYECPYISQTYKEYIEANELDDEIDDKVFLDYYENYLNQCPLKEDPLMIRYDYDPLSYFEGLHPISHIHIGLKNHIRIGIPKVIGPKVFFNFVIRQNYPAFWKRMIKDEEWKKIYLNEKKSLIIIEKQYWQELDYNEFHFV